MTANTNTTMTAKVFILWFALLWLCMPMVQAEQVENIYRHKILVANQSAETRQESTKKALEQVLVRATGLLAPAQNPKIKSLLSNADAFVSSFYYENSEELIRYRGQKVQASSLVLNFSKQVIENLLQEYGLPVWPSNRPSILVWMVQDSASGRSIPSLTDDSYLAGLLDRGGNAYGLPLVFPVMDLQDQRAINSGHLWRLDVAKVNQASLRYQVDSSLVVRYSQTSSGQWIASWTLLQNGRQAVFDSRGKTQAEFIDNGLREIMSHMAGLYSIVSDGVVGAGVSMSISGIDNFVEYMSLLNYVNGLAVVEDVVVVSVLADTMLLDVYINGELSLLLGALALDRKLEEAQNIVIESDLVIDQSKATNTQPVLLSPRGSAMNPLRFIWP